MDILLCFSSILDGSVCHVIRQRLGTNIFPVVWSVPALTKRCVLSISGALTLCLGRWCWNTEEKRKKKKGMHYMLVFATRLNPRRGSCWIGQFAQCVWNESWIDCERALRNFFGNSPAQFLLHFWFLQSFWSSTFSSTVTSIGIANEVFRESPFTLRSPQMIGSQDACQRNI